MKKIVSTSLLALLLLMPMHLSAATPEPDRIEIPPVLTGSDISMTGGPHIAMVDHSVLSRNRLLIFLGGTLSYPGNYLYFTTLAARGGYHVLNLSYPNLVSSQSCFDDPDSLCYEKFRQEIVWGGDVSSCVSVDSANSIMNRIVRALEYLVKSDNRGGWDAFIDRGGHLIYERIVFAGHSQGAGHAVYLAKQFPVERVLLFSGPNDWLTKGKKPTGWLGQESSTPLSEYYSLLHRKDEVGIFKWQYEIRRRFAGIESGDTVNVDRDVPPYNHARCLVTALPSAIPSDGKGVFHNATIMDAYVPRSPTDSMPLLTKTWRYMLDMPEEADTIGSRMMIASRGFRLQAVPVRDAAGRFLYRFDLPVETKVRVTLYTLRGKKVATLIDAMVLPGAQTIVVDKTHLAPGAYMLHFTAGSRWVADRALTVEAPVVPSVKPDSMVVETPVAKVKTRRR